MHFLFFHRCVFSGNFKESKRFSDKFFTLNLPLQNKIFYFKFWQFVCYSRTLAINTALRTRNLRLYPTYPTTPSDTLKKRFFRLKIVIGARHTTISFILNLPLPTNIIFILSKLFTKNDFLDFCANCNSYLIFQLKPNFQITKKRFNESIHT